MERESGKPCALCGRWIEWRKKWERSWPDVRYCSTACRRHGVTAEDRRIEADVRGALRRRPVVAFRELVTAAAAREDEDVKRAVRRVVADGAAELVQRGRVVDPSTVRGEFDVRRSNRV